jgi:signal transduction histidine kinase
VLAERTRLAQELHDTLEQTLIGISLQLDAAAKLWDRGAAEARQHLDVAVSWIRQSQTDLRRSIWDLRTRALDEFDLAKELARNGQQIAGVAGIAVEMKTDGSAFRLPEVVEENILRIGQEALTNVVKHSGAKRVRITLCYAPGCVSLEVKDDGCGLSNVDRRGPEESHFGLLGMSERAARLDGRLEVVSPRGEGVTVRVQVPLNEKGAIA